MGAKHVVAQVTIVEEERDRWSTVQGGWPQTCAIKVGTTGQMRIPHGGLPTGGRDLSADGTQGAGNETLLSFERSFFFCVLLAPIAVY